MRSPGPDATPADDPYRPPRASLIEAAAVDPEEATWCWRDGDALVVLKHRPLPLRCVKCNRAVDERMRTKSFVRVPPWLIVFAPLALATPAALQAWAPARAESLAVWLILLQCAIVIAIHLRAAWRHSSRHAIGLCSLHRYRRVLAVFAIVLVNVAAVGASLSFTGPRTWLYWPIVATGVQLGMSLLLVRYVATALRPLRIDARFARFAGCGPSFLQSLAEFRGETVPVRTAASAPASGKG